MSCRHRRFADELRADAAALRRMAETLDRRAAEEDGLARQAMARRDLASRRYADDHRGFRGLPCVSPGLPGFGPPG